MAKALVRHFAENRNPRKVGPDVIVQVRCYSRAHIRQFDNSPDAIAIEPINNRADCHNQQGHKPPLLPEGPENREYDRGWMRADLSVRIHSAHQKRIPAWGKTRVVDSTL